MGGRGCALWQVSIQHGREMAEALHPEGDWPRPSASGQRRSLAATPPSHSPPHCQGTAGSPGAPAAPALASEHELSR